MVNTKTAVMGESIVSPDKVQALIERIWYVCFCWQTLEFAELQEVEHQITYSEYHLAFRLGIWTHGEPSYGFLCDDGRCD